MSLICHLIKMWLRSKALARLNQIWYKCRKQITVSSKLKIAIFVFKQVNPSLSSPAELIKTSASCFSAGRKGPISCACLSSMLLELHAEILLTISSVCVRCYFSRAEVVEWLRLLNNSFFFFIEKMCNIVSTLLHRRLSKT